MATDDEQADQREQIKDTGNEATVHNEEEILARNFGEPVDGWYGKPVEQ